VDKLAALVPELYYDLIGRFVPGALGTALFATTFLAMIPYKTTTSEFLLTCLGVAVAYSVGLLLDVASGMTIGPLNLAFRRSVRSLPIQQKGREVDHVEPWNFMRGKGDPEAGAVVGKLLAERTCLRSLSLLWLLVWLTGTPPAAALGLVVHFALIACLLVGQYHWEYLARATAFTYGQSMSRAKP
jgi:hypothetical protein